jgi:hypothetical protein
MGNSSSIHTTPIKRHKMMPDIPADEEELEESNYLHEHCVLTHGWDSPCLFGQKGRKVFVCTELNCLAIYRLPARRMSRQLDRRLQTISEEESFPSAEEHTLFCGSCADGDTY